MIVEDDVTFASILLDLAREAGLKGVVSTAGAGTLALARKLQPDAITLDLGLSDIDGFVLLDLLKHDPKTRHLPIHVISGADQAELVLGMGAFSVTTKPADHEELNQVFRSIHSHISRTDRRVLVVGGDAAYRKAVSATVADAHVQVQTAASAAKAKGDLAAFDAFLIAAGSTEDLRRQLAGLDGAAATTPVLILPGGIEPHALEAVTAEVGGQRELAVVHSLDKLATRLGPVLRRGRRPTNDNDAAQQQPVTRAVPELAGAKILIVDDDIRNIYSLTSVLESYDVDVLHAERGKEGIAILEAHQNIDIALIDIMMPEMDGYETMRQIRSRPALADVPLVAVTAKAMKGDRQKCLDAGASDYIAKPVDIELLLALLRVWISRSRERTVANGARLAPAAAE
jgi:CheY-like chemotaxis protein